MKFFGTGVQNVRGCRLAAWLRRRGGLIAVAGHIVDDNAGLHVIAVNTERDACTVILHRLCFHQHAVRNGIVAFKDRCDAV